MWHHGFKDSCELEDDQHSGQPVVHSGHHWMIETIPKIVRILVDNCHTILSKDLKMRHIYRHVVPRMLFVRNSAITNEGT